MHLDLARQLRHYELNAVSEYTFLGCVGKIQSGTRCVNIHVCFPPSYDTSMHLKALRPQLEEMEECEYGELEQRFPPLFHTICLIWRHSRHYKQPARLVVLLQEISNLMIELVHITSRMHFVVL